MNLRNISAGVEADIGGVWSTISDTPTGETHHAAKLPPKEMPDSR